ncbi:hypothetical protein RJI07_08665 [Mycoplasmatota bacterium WC30]
MRKLIVILLVFISMILISCEPNKYFFKNNTRNDEVTSIELISYSSEDVAVIESTDEMMNFNTNNIEVLEMLDTTKNEDFVSEFSNIEFLLGYPHLNTPNGIGVKINYDNGDFLIVTDSLDCEECYGGDAILYNSEGQFLDYYGGFSWRQNFVDLINDYFQTQID